MGCLGVLRVYWSLHLSGVYFMCAVTFCRCGCLVFIVCVCVCVCVCVSLSLTLTSCCYAGRWDCPWHHCDVCGKNYSTIPFVCIMYSIFHVMLKCIMYICI